MLAKIRCSVPHGFLEYQVIRSLETTGEGVERLAVYSDDYGSASGKVVPVRILIEVFHSVA
jgi:hypothetical protein